MFDTNAKFGDLFDQQSYVPSYGTGERITHRNSRLDASGLSIAMSTVDGKHGDMTVSVADLVKEKLLPIDPMTVIT